VFGSPVVPPALATRGVNRLRAFVARVHRAVAPPPVLILEAVMGSLDGAALATLCELDVPDRLQRRVAVPELASELDVDAERLRRLLRYSAARGWVSLDRKGRVRPNAVTAFLRRDHPGGWRAWVEFGAGREVANAQGALRAAMRADGDPFAEANGAPFFAWMADHPERHARFDAAMEAGGQMHGLVLARALDWSQSRRVCDIGGGTGALLRVLLGAHPHLQGTVLDLPSVVAGAAPVARMTVEGGDAFASVPAGHDTYMMVNVVHDWVDGAVSTLFRRVAEAMAATPPATGVRPRLVVVEGELGGRPRDDIATRSDLLMLALTPGGQERTADELARLAGEAGLSLDRSIALASGDRAYVFSPTAI
jgi:hypothetical protein